MTCPDRLSRPSNRPGLPALRYRLGDYATFRARLLERLTCALVTSDQPQGISLRKLNTRTNDDPAIALLDACAVVADVLTFYQERIINEGYLLTATERRSVLELARSIGYELHPGVAASTLLAFTVEAAPDAPKVAAIAKGTQILSIPEQDELPQTFETSADFTAHVEWNALKPRPARPQKLTPTTDRLFLKGTNTGLQPGDLLLLMDGEDHRKPHYFLTIDRVEPNPANGYTLIFWQSQLLEPPPRNPSAIAFRQRANLFGFNAPRWDTVSDAIKLATGSKIKGGVYRASEAAQPQWQSVNTGLLNFDIRCLAVTSSGTVLAGTPLGLFRSKDNGETWVLANSGLTNFSIQTIFARDNLLVGTPGGGVFRSTDDGETWSPIGIGSVTVKIFPPARSGDPQVSQPENTGIPNTVVRSLTSIAFTLSAPTLSAIHTSEAPGRSEENRVRITRGAGIVPLNLKVGDVIIAENQIRQVTTVFPIDLTNPNAPIEVLINAPFRNAPTAESLTGTPRNLDEGTPFTAYRPSSATAAAPLLLASSGGSYILAATDIGVYRSSDQGKNWYGSNNPDNQPIRGLATAAGNVFASTDRTIYQSSDQGENWIPTSLIDKTIRSIVAHENDAFVATNDGVWRSQSGGDWNQVKSGLTDLNVWSIALNSSSGHLFAFTANGVFKSVDQGDNWTVWSGASQNPNLTAVVPCVRSSGSSTFLFAGAAFTGFEKEGEEGWANFRLPTPAPGENSQIDLSTTYPKLLEESWLILQSGDRKTNQLYRIQSIAEVQRQDFTLDSKISRILAETSTELEQFNLRESIALIQSEPLPLIDEPLTVELQQTNIFFDPIWTNKVLLSQYVAGLQAQHPVIVSGKRMRSELLNVGGVVQLTDQNNKTAWQRLNSGLTNTSVAAFTQISTSNQATSTNTLLVGTAGGGVFRSIDSGAWEAINQGLTTLDIQSIAVLKDIDLESNKYQIFVGTAIGVFQTDWIANTDTKVEWKQVNGNLAYSDVRSLLPVNISFGNRAGILLAGTVNGGVLLLTIDRDRTDSNHSTWIQTGLAGVDVQTLIQATDGDIYAGTIADGVFRGVVSDRGITWQPLNEGLADSPNVTSLVSYSKAGSGRMTTSEKIVIGENEVSRNGTVSRTQFTTELAIGDTITIGTETRRVRRVLSDFQLEIESKFLNDVEQFSPFQVTRVLAGTPGSGIFRLKPDAAQRSIWEPVANNPADLNVLCLAANSEGEIFAGTASGGIFQSIDEGNLWTPLNSGLTSLDSQINPAAKVNTEFRAIAFVNQTLFAAGIGILISPDNLYTIPIRAGDRLQVMAPPVPLPQKGREVEDAISEQKWILSDRDGFLGVVFTAAPTDVRLQPADAADPFVSEQNAIALPPQDQQAPLLTLSDPLQNSYDPQTVKIYANVVAATHGETIQEILGNGDSTLTHQKFFLQKPPLTYVSATTPSGAATTLQVRVNEVLWREVPSLYQRSPRDPVYMTRIADDRSVTITTGDGISGARLPTGLENVTATYRSGIGLAGRVGADRLSLLKTRPLGIAAVTNPLPATGAADPETMAEARTSAPLTVRTLDRIVSLQDYEDFARAFAGIGKAQADLLAGETQLVHVTVAAIGGQPVLPDTPLYTNLIGAIDAARDPVQQVRVTSFEAIAFNLEAKLLIDDRYLPDRVVAQAKAALLQRFVFERRQFGQAVTAAEAIATLQAVEGMIAVDLDALHRRDRTRSLEQWVTALPARWDAATREILPAQLLVINPAGIRLRVEATL